MSRLAGTFRNIFNSIFRAKQKVTCVGSDEFGNKYFERLADKAHNLKGARWVEPVNKDTVEPPDVPTAWDSWLRKKRFSPPTQEEIEQNYITMMRTIARAKELEEKERLERYEEEEERKTVDANLGDFVKNVTRETGNKKPFPTREDLEEKPGSFMDKKYR